jgi:predicted DCC family thiol-disulfide oxidoreductase YuxK
MSMQQGIVLFDGVCNLCNGWVNFLIRHDKKRVLKYGSLQSASAKALLSAHGLNPEVLNSIVFIQSGKAYSLSAAVLEICKTLGGYWRLFYIFKIIPSILRDGIYRIVAKNRYQWFGMRNHCRLPTAEERALFMEEPAS